MPFLIAAAVVALLAFLVWGSLSALKRRRLLEDLPTSKTTGVFIGLVELKGTAESENPHQSFLAEQRCVLYSWTVEEHWSRTVTETYHDSDGKTKTRTRTESGGRPLPQEVTPLCFISKTILVSFESIRPKRRFMQRISLTRP